MSEVTSPRLDQLFKMLEKQPQDTFLLYGIGMEYRKLKAAEKAIEYFDRVLGVDSAYCYAYFQKGQVYEQMGRNDQARGSYYQGIAAARKAGDAHAQGELEAALSMLE